MEFCSYFIKDRALFGSFPTTERVRELENNGVCYYVDLTCNDEVENPYITTYPIIKFPIEDRKVPVNIRLFCKCIIKIANVINSLKDNEKIYIHCRGGHGRAGLVVACLLCYLFKHSPDESIRMTGEFHSQRKTMREKWREIGSPQTRRQKSFIFKLFKPLYFYKAYRNGPAVGLSNLSEHPIELDIGIFGNSLAAYESHRDLLDRAYIIQLQNCSSYQAKMIGVKKNKLILHKYEVMKHILELKIKQNPTVKNTLIETGFRPIIYTYKYDEYWGLGINDNGQNMLGKLWIEIRSEFYKD